MTHASLELVWMMLGYAINDATTFTHRFTDKAASTVVCGAETEDENRVYGWFGDWTAEQVFKQHHTEVDCPSCLVALDAAREGRLLVAEPK